MTSRWLITASIGALTVIVFSRNLQNSFIGYDDPKYVTENRHVLGGITAANLNWAFNAGYFSSWHPLTWISHMLDVQVFGVRAWGHHAVSVVLFAAAAGALFLTLQAATGATWRSAAAAILWAWHPLRVQSVAWVSERKDVLAILFGLLALYSYTRFAQRRAIGWYAALLCFAALSLMSKAMWVTIPAVLILWDIWPLDRWRRDRAAKLILEKLPLLALSIGASIITYIAQSRGGAVAAGAIYSFNERLGNALVALVRYLYQFFWPVDLAVYYPFPRGGWPLNTVVLAGSLLLIITVAAATQFRRRPYLLVGWLWFLGMLVPMIGVVQVGSQSMADRYTLAPMIGLTFAAVWLAADLMPRSVPVRAGVAAAVALALAARTFVELGHWKNSFLLFSRAHAVTGGSFISHGFLGSEFARQQNDTAAEAHFLEALRLNPKYAEVHFNYGNLLRRRGELDRAASEYARAAELKPALAAAHNNLGVILAQAGRFSEAADRFSRAADADPLWAEPRLNLGGALVRQGKLEQAIAEFQRVLQIQPGNETARRNLAAAEAARLNR